MEFKDRLKLFLRSLRIMEEGGDMVYGMSTSLIKTLILQLHKIDIPDIDIKYMLEKGYIKPWVGEYNGIYISSMGYMVKISTKGIDYLEEENNPPLHSQQIVQYVQSHFANVSGTGNIQQTIINDSFKDTYSLIEKSVTDDKLKEDLIRSVKEIEEGLKKNDFEKVKTMFEKLKKKAEFLTPILQGIIVEAFKKWTGF